MIHDIYIIDDSIEKKRDLKEIFEQKKQQEYMPDDFKFKRIKTNQLDMALLEIPSLIVIDADFIETDLKDICRRIRQDDNNTITPVVVLSSNIDKNYEIEILKEQIEYYIRKPVEMDYLFYTIKNIIRLIHFNRRVSPLTGLPGNVQIQAELKKRLLKKEKFAVLYLDLDNFKAYNDKYGFLKGDEVIKFTAKVISKHVHIMENEDDFVGHIGGDDFVAIISQRDYDDICQNIIAEFDTQVLEYFEPEDLEKGYLEVANRKSIIERFPLTSISIGVVVVDQMQYENILEIGEIGAQVKHISKTIIGSSYAINRRNNNV